MLGRSLILVWFLGIGVMLEDLQALRTGWLGQLGERKGVFLLTLLALSSLGAVGSFWQMCVYVWSLSP